MGQSLDLTRRRVQRFCEITAELWRDVENRHLSFAEYIEKRQLILEDPDHKSLPIWAKERLRGYDTARYDMVWSKMTFSYMLDDKRVLVDSPEFNDACGTLHDRETAGTFDPSTGCHVWADAPDKIWS